MDLTVITLSVVSVICTIGCVFCIRKSLNQDASRFQMLAIVMALIAVAKAFN